MLLLTAAGWRWEKNPEADRLLTDAEHKQWVDGVRKTMPSLKYLSRRSWLVANQGNAKMMDGCGRDFPADLKDFMSLKTVD